VSIACDPANHFGSERPVTASGHTGHDGEQVQGDAGSGVSNGDVATGISQQLSIGEAEPTGPMDIAGQIGRHDVSRYPGENLHVGSSYRTTTDQRGSADVRYPDVFPVEFEPDSASDDDVIIPLLPVSKSLIFSVILHFLCLFWTPGISWCFYISLSRRHGIAVRQCQS
jgi:hypothetical protein